VAAVAERAAGEPAHGVLVVVADADAAARRQTTRLLKQAGFEVRVAETGSHALELTRSLGPAAVLLDVALPELSGYQVCHLLREEYGRELAIVLLSADRTEPHDRVAGLLVGADDYVVKPFEPDELLARLEAHTRAGPRAAEKALASLTPGERRALGMLAEGMTTKGIARALSVTPKTVGMHINNAMKKLDVHSRTQAVALAYRYGLVNGGVGDGADAPSSRPASSRRSRGAPDEGAGSHS
jgi:DNA-binding NarL/FixJ family response regulator